MNLGFPAPLGRPVPLGGFPPDAEPPSPPSRRFVVPLAARRVVRPGVRSVDPRRAEARPPKR